MKSRLIAAWLLSTVVAVALAYQAVGLVQTQVTEGAPLLAAVEVTSTTISAEDLPPIPPTVTIPDDLEDRVDAPPVSQPTDVVVDSTVPDSTPSTATTSPADTTSTTSPPDGTTTTTTLDPTATPTVFIIPSDGGTVNVVCTGDSIGFRSALASPGFQTSIKSEGPQEVRVDFEDLNEDHTFEIKASCRDGEVKADVGEDD
jgi:hypothetical protein